MHARLSSRLLHGIPTFANFPYLDKMATSSLTWPCLLKTSSYDTLGASSTLNLHAEGISNLIVAVK